MSPSVRGADRTAPRNPRTLSRLARRATDQFVAARRDGDEDAAATFLSQLMTLANEAVAQVRASR